MFASGLSMLISIRDIKKKTKQKTHTSGYGICAAPYATGLWWVLAGPKGATSPTWMQTNFECLGTASRFGANFAEASLVLKGFAAFQQDISAISHHFAVQILPQLPLKLSLGAAVQEALLTRAVQGQHKQVCSATFCTSGTLCCGKGLRKEALSFCCFFYVETLL